MPPLVSTMHRVLGIPELLDTIFKFLDFSCNASNARVCKKWSEIALDILWRNVEDLYRLFNILAPLRLTGNQHEFYRLPDSGDWLRFDHYRRRVRRLSYQANIAKRVLHQSVFDDIARTRTNLDILPNMHTLEWNAPPDLSIMFMHANVKRFYITLPDVVQQSSPRPFFLDISTRMPNVRHLDIRTRVPMRFIEPQMVALVTSLKKLQKIVLPRFALTAPLLEGLSHLDHLEVIEFQYYPEQGEGDPNDVIQFNPTLSEHAFPSLWDFSAAFSCAAAARLFDIPFAPISLTMLFLESPIIETPAEVHQLFTIIGNNCQLLQTLCLMTTSPYLTAANTREDEDFWFERPDKDVCLTIETLAPLFRCAKLTSFEVDHHYPLYLQEEDVVKLALKWPSIETLMLNNEPAHIESTTLTLSSLLPFAEHCPNLKHLGLFIDASSGAELPPPAPSSSSSKTRYIVPAFRSLCRLSLGVSMIDDPDPVAMFLSHICPAGLQLELGITHSHVPHSFALQVESRCAGWYKVTEVLPLLIRLRTEERERAKALQWEVEDLRIRTRILTDWERTGNTNANANARLGDSCVIF